MTPQSFVAKWSKIQQKETAVAKGHFYDLCQLVGHLKPEAYDPTGQTFSFETQTVKTDGQKGFADVFFREHFIWEYKGPHQDLDKAYQQLLLYREALDNPPLLITSDIHTIVIHTNFNNYPRHSHTITFADILQGDGLAKLRWAFFEPEKFKPARTQEQITKASADTFVAVADAMKKHQKVTGEAYSAEQLAHFMVRLLFCLFAEDMALLPNNVFTQIVRAQGESYADLHHGLRNLFREMRSGGTFGFYRIRHFDGTLFDDDFVPTIPHDLARALLQAAGQNWAAVDPSIFGTLFERVIDEEKRAQLGAHYTSEQDIMLIVEPVLMEPLRRQWDEVRRQADRLLRASPPLTPSPSPPLTPATEGYPSPHQLLADFAAQLATIRVLDAGCGSGNFLYVALRQLLSLQKEVIAYAARRGLPPIELTVSPEQLYGIEINPYAHELAQITVWIGYLQWRQENGFGQMSDPILRPLRNIQRMDAILAYDEDGRPVEPEWPAADVIIGNPPFLGGNKIRQELGDKTVDNLFKLYEGHIPAFADLVCYWFEKARAQIEQGKAQRAGLIATNSIRGGVNRAVLKRIKQTGDIFMAWSDNPWVLDGAAVRVSLVGFDNGSEQVKKLDGAFVSRINPDLTMAVADLTQAKILEENQLISFQGPSPKGAFDIEENVARQMLKDPHNQEVIRPVMSAIDIMRRSRGKWSIDFALMPIEQAKKYEAPFEYVRQLVFPVRSKNRRLAYAEKWWQYAEARPGMRQALNGLTRFVVTPRVAKHRMFIWAEPQVLANDGTIVFAREDDYFFGVLHSRPHELWALRLGTSLEDRPRYTPTTSFETFPFPWPPGQEPAEAADERVAEIAHWARQLVYWRDAWLNPPPPPDDVIDVAYNRLLQNRTLTNLYNGLQYFRHTIKAGQPFQRSEFDKVTRHAVGRAEIQELDDIHAALDAAVLRAYGWSTTLSDEQILERLLALNLQRAKTT
jgi:SAM-dependent methyltransferase